MGESDIILAIQQMWSAFDWHKGTWTVRREEVVEFARGLLDEQNSYKKDAERYRFIRATTKAVRADDGEGRIEVTPEKFDAMTDISIEIHKDAEAQDAFYRAIRAQSK